jgi:hypothetical protein
MFTREANLPQYFGQFSSNFTPNVRDPLGAQVYMRGDIMCREAKFELKPSDAERYYTDLFYYIFGVLENVVNRLRAARMVNGIEIREFGEIIDFRPKENTESLVPVFPMKEIWSRLWVRDFYNNYANDKEKLSFLLKSHKNVLSKDDAKLLEQIAKFQKDYRGFISKHADEIMGLNRKLIGDESWEARFRKDGGQRLKAEMDAALGENPMNKVNWAPMPLSEADASAIREFSSKMLSALPVLS